MNWLLYLLSVIWFLLPGALANMAPVFVKKLDLFNYPLDFGKKANDKERVLGPHKTFRGLIFAIVFAIIGVGFQKLLFRFNFFEMISVVDYSTLNVWLFGFLIGFGVMFGDAFGSFFKRRFKIKPGAMFFPVDQLDSAVFMILFLLPFYKLSLLFSFLVVFIWFFGHMLINYIGWLLKIKKNKF